MKTEWQEQFSIWISRNELPFTGTDPDKKSQKFNNYV